MPDDAKLIFSDNQALGAGGTVNSSNSIDTEIIRDIGAGHALFIKVIVMKANNSVVRATVNLRSSNTINSSGDLSGTIFSVPVMSIPQNKAGTYAVGIPLLNEDDWRLYWQLQYVRTSPVTGFNLWAGITDSRYTQHAYSKGYTF